jgi:hypothetical protein
LPHTLVLEKKRRMMKVLLSPPPSTLSSMHDEGPFIPFTLHTELNNGVPIKRPVPAHGLDEDAFGVMGVDLLCAVDVLKAEHLAAEQVVDEARDVGIYVVTVAIDTDCSAFAFQSGANLGNEGRRGKHIIELEVKEASPLVAQTTSPKMPPLSGSELMLGRGFMWWPGMRSSENHGAW